MHLSANGLSFKLSVSDYAKKGTPTPSVNT